MRVHCYYDHGHWDACVLIMQLPFSLNHCIVLRTIRIGNHTHSSPIWEIIVLAILKIVRGKAEYEF